MNIVLWIVQGLLALLFLLAGTTKFFIPYSEMIKDQPVVLPHALLLFIGACEVLGAIGLIVPWATGIRPSLTPLAALLLIIIMIGAVVITLMGPMAVGAVFPAIVGLLCGFVAWGRKRPS